jgi:hypothetical protein
MISPDALRQEGIDIMLAGREPQFEVDQLMLMNFYAVAITPAVALPVCKLMNKLYEMGLGDRDVEYIVNFQLTAKGIGTN